MANNFKKSNYLLVKNNKTNFILLMIFFSLDIIIILFDAIGEVDKSLTKIIDLNNWKVNLYQALKIAVYLAIMLVMVSWIMSFANYEKMIKRNKTINIYRKYENLVYENLKSTERMCKKWYYNAWQTISTSTVIFINKIAVAVLFIAAIIFFMSKLLPFIAFNGKYLDQYIDSNFYSFFQLFEKQPDSANKLILTCLTLAYIGLVIFRIYNLCLTISLKIQVGDWDKILNKYEAEQSNNKVILSLIKAICLEKKKEYKFHKRRFLVAILPTFMLSSVVFGLEFAYFALPQSSRIFSIISLFCAAIIISYQVVRFIAYTLDHATNEDYSIKCGEKLRLTFEDMSEEDIDKDINPTISTTSSVVNDALIEKLTELKEDIQFLRSSC